MPTNRRQKEQSPRPQRILVTGAAGCVGALLVDELLDGGWSVVATDRPGAPCPKARAGLTWLEADLTAPDSAPRLVRGVDAVIHTAAWVDIAVPFDEQAPINLHAVRYLYEAAEAEGVGAFLHFSTGSLYAPKDGPLTEEDALWPTSGYEETKLLAEDFLRARVGTGPRVTILRPALIYGPRGKVLVAPLATFPHLLERLGRRMPRVRGGPRTNLIHALDVARAAVHLLAHPQPDGAIFNVAPAASQTAGELLEVIFTAGGIRIVPIPIPYPKRLFRVAQPFLKYPALFRGLNRATGALWKRVVAREGLTDGLAPRVDMEAMTYLGGDAVFDPSRLLATGFELRFPNFAEGWDDTVRWYREHHWLPAAAGESKGQQALPRAA